MNRKQKIILCIGVSLFLLAAIFPVKRYRPRRFRTNKGLIDLNKPSITEFVPDWLTNRVFYAHSYDVQLYSVAVELFVITVVTGGLFLAFKSKTREATPMKRLLRILLSIVVMGGGVGIGILA